MDLCLQNEDEAGVMTEEQVRIATAIYPTVSLMNHSCDASISARQVVMKSELFSLSSRSMLVCVHVHLHTFRVLGQL